jgi:hypothetical protein
MAVNDNVSRNQYTATSLQTVFPYTFEIFDDDDVVVLQKVKATGVTNTLSKTTHYTVSSVGNDNGGNITLVTGAATGDILTIYRDMALERLVDYQNSGDFKAGTVNDDFDRLWIALQQQNANAGLAIRAPTDDTVLNSTNTTLSNVATRGGKLLGFAPDGTLNYSSVAAATADYVDVPTVATMTALSSLTAGVSVVNTANFYTSTGGGGTYDVIAGTGTANGANIIAHDTLSLSFVLRVGSVPNILQFGAIPSNAASVVTATDLAFRYLAAKTNPGGFVYYPKTDTPYLFNAKTDLVALLFDEQGITYPPATSGTTLPNGEIVRNVTFGIVGDNVQFKAVSPFTGNCVFQAGEYDGGTGFGQAHKFFIEGVEAIGFGVIGHANKDIFEAKYTILADANKGTDDTTLEFVRLQNVIPGSYFKEVDIRLFNKGVALKWGFGFDYQTGSVQYCNEGISGEQGCTNIALGKGVEIELCAAGVLFTQNTQIRCDAIIEANSLAVGLYSSSFFNCSSWLEGNTLDVALRSINTAAHNRHVHFEGSVGPSSLDNNGGLVEFSLRNSPTGSSYAFGVSSGEMFKNIIFENNDIESTSDGFDLSALSVSGIAKLEDITVKGRVKNQLQANYGCRDTVTLKGNTSSSSATAVKAFDVIVPNIEANARIEITAHKSAANASDMRVQTMHYVGVIERFTGAATIVEFSTTESIVTNYNTTGTNVPVSVAVPTVTITGAVGAEQTVAVEFPTGTAVSGTANTIWDVNMNVLVGAMSLTRA